LPIAGDAARAFSLPPLFRCLEDQMAKSKPPADIIEKRDVLHGPETTRDVLVSLGDHYFESGAIHDALSFYVRADHEPGLKRVVDAAIADGQTFLLQRIERSHRFQITPDVWRHTAESAEAKGKLRYALTGWERAGDEARADAIRVKLGIAVVAKALPGTEIVDPSIST
jgi:hypothetical protein